MQVVLKYQLMCEYIQTEFQSNQSNPQSNPITNPIINPIINAIQSITVVLMKPMCIDLEQVVIPLFNTMVVFEVVPGESAHSVQEVYADRNRLSIQVSCLIGW